MQTLWAVVSIICRVLLLGMAVPVLLRDFPDYTIPSRITTDWAALALGDILTVVAPLMRWRKVAFLAAALALGAHYYFRHHVPALDLAYMGVAILFVVLPSSERQTKPTVKTR